MKTGTAVAIGLGVVAVYYFSQLGVAAGTVNFLFKSFQFQTATSIKVVITVQNVSNISATINSMDGTATLDGSTLGNLSDFTPVTVGGNSQVDVPIIFNISILSLPGTIMAAIQQGGQTLDFAVSGNANVNGLVIPFTIDNPVTF